MRTLVGIVVALLVVGSVQTALGAPTPLIIAVVSTNTVAGTTTMCIYPTGAWTQTRGGVRGTRQENGHLSANELNKLSADIDGSKVLDMPEHLGNQASVEPAGLSLEIWFKDRHHRVETESPSHYSPIEQPQVDRFLKLHGEVFSLAGGLSPVSR